MDWERWAAIAKSRNLRGKDALRFFDECQKERVRELEAELAQCKERQLQLERECEREREALAAQLKKRLHQAERGPTVEDNETGLDLPAEQSVEISEHEVVVNQFKEIQASQEIVSAESEVTELQEIQGSQEFVSVESEECGAVTASLEELESEVVDAGAGAQEMFSAVREEKVHPVQENQECIAGCCKHVLDQECIAGCCKHILNGVCSDARPTVKDVTSSHDLCDNCALLESEHSEGEVREWSSTSGSEEVTLEEKADADAANGGLDAMARQRTQVQKKLKVSERGRVTERRSSRRRGKVGCKRRLKRRKRRGLRWRQCASSRGAREMIQKKRFRFNEDERRRRTRRARRCAVNRRARECCLRRRLTLKDTKCIGHTRCSRANSARKRRARKLGNENQRRGIVKRLQPRAKGSARVVKARLALKEGRRSGCSRRSRERAVMSSHTRVGWKRHTKRKQKKRWKKFDSVKRSSHSDRFSAAARRRTRLLSETPNGLRKRNKAERFFLWPLKKRKRV